MMKIPPKAIPILHQISKVKKEVEKLRNDMISGDFKRFMEVQEKWAAKKVVLSNLEAKYDNCFSGEIPLKKRLERPIPEID